MQIDKELVRQHFDRHAHEYDRYAVVQAYMAEKLAELLRSNHPPQGGGPRILEIGSGTGLLTQLLLDQYTAAKITAVDLSASMLAALRQKLGSRSEQVVFVEGDAEELAAGGGLSGEAPYDLIVSSATFQWFNDPAHTMARFRDKLAQGGVLAFATFAPGTFQELHASFGAAEEQLGLPRGAHGQSFCTAEQWSSFFPICSLDDRFIWHQETFVQHFPGVKDFLYAVKRVGAGNANRRGEQPTFAGKRLFADMQRYYEDHYGEEAGIRATYCLGFGLYKKA